MNQDPKELARRHQPKEGKPVKTDLQLAVLRYAPCGKVLAAGGHDGTVRRWDADNLAELPPLRGHNGWVQCLAFHPDRQRLYTADTWGRLACWPYADRDAKPLWQNAAAHDGWVRSLAVAPDGAHIATGGRDGAVRLWSADGKKVRDFTEHRSEVYAVAFHPTSKTLVSGDLKGVVKHWEAATGKVLREYDASSLYLYERIQDVGGVRVLVFDATGGTLVAAGAVPKTGGFVQATPRVLFFDAATGQVKHTFQGATDNEGFVHDLHWHPDGFVMGVASGQPGQGKLFFLVPGEATPFFATTKMPNCHSLAVHPSGGRLAVAATNANSAGNGRQLRNGEYPANTSPIHVWDLPKA